MRWASVLSSALLVAGASAVPHLIKDKRIAASSSSAVPSSTPSPSGGYWLANVKHQGNAPYAGSGYSVFRNVKDYGAAGDGSTDDTDAINKAISDGDRTSPASNTTTSTTPAIVYFPPGTYVVSKPIIDYYFTQLIGDPNSPATLKASSSFQGMGVIDGDQYQSNGKEGWISTNIFLRQVRNFIIDLTDIPGTTAATGIHWPSSQATSVQNVVINMNADAGSQHQGFFIEDGSGGWISDIVINGGLYGMNIGNQQFTYRNISISNAATAISQIWDWGWTYIGLNIQNCTTGINIANGGSSAQNVGGVNILDSTISNVHTFVNTSWTTSSSPAGAGNLILENVVLDTVTTAVQGPSDVYLQGGSSTIASFGQGHEYTPTGPHTLQGTYAPIARPSGLTSGGSGSKYFTKAKPQYANIPVSQVSSIRDAGAKGDGTTDDTKAINSALSSAASSGKIVFFDYGIYRVTDTIYFPPGVKVVGESYPVIAGSGDAFSDATSPLPVVQVGKPGDKGTIEWSDFRVGTIGGAAGAIAIEWNLNGEQGSGMWDVHTLIGGWTGSNLQVKQCPTSASVSANCQAAFMSLHITKDAQNFYSENNWFWTADHDIDDPTNTRVSVYTGRGVLVEGTNVEMWGTGAEHHGLYQFQFHGATNVVGGYFQTETPYYQPKPDATAGPYKSNTTWNDPDFSTCLSGNCDALGLRVSDSSSLAFYGTGLYSFFNNYDTSCSNSGGSENCQSEIFRVDGKVSDLNIYGFNTVGVTNMITINGTSAAKYSDNLSVYPDSIALFSY